MTAYYNEHDPYAAQWLRNLIAAGHIAAGDVDERSISDVTADDVRGYTQCHFFAGIGVWAYALRRAGWADDEEIWSASCPCQPFSDAGGGEGFADERHLWPAFHHIANQRRPAAIVGEQVASADGLAWFDLVSADLEASDYAVAPADLSAAGYGGAHKRQRLYFVAVANSIHARPQGHGRPSGMAEAAANGHGPNAGGYGAAGSADAWDWVEYEGKRFPVRSGTFPLAHAPAARVGRLRAYGNALDAETATNFLAAVRDCLP